MKIFVNEKSHHSNQKRFEQIPAHKRIFLGLFIVIIVPILFLVLLYTTPKSIYAIYLLAKEQEIVNVNFFALMGIGGFFLFPAILFVAYLALRYRRVTIPEELTPPFRKFVMGSFKATFFCLLAASPLCIALSFALIYLNDYSWCPKMSLGSGWDSWWVIDPQLCKSPE